MLRSVGCFNTDVSALILSPKTTLRNQPTLRNIPEDDKIRLKKNLEAMPGKR
jgi:hypothetical protein